MFEVGVHIFDDRVPPVNLFGGDSVSDLLTEYTVVVAVAEAFHVSRQMVYESMPGSTSPTSVDPGLVFT